MKLWTYTRLQLHGYSRTDYGTRVRHDDCTADPDEGWGPVTRLCYGTYGAIGSQRSHPAPLQMSARPHRRRLWLTRHLAGLSLSNSIQCRTPPSVTIHGVDIACSDALKSEKRCRRLRFERPPPRIRIRALESSSAPGLVLLEAEVWFPQPQSFHRASSTPKSQ